MFNLVDFKGISIPNVMNAIKKIKVSALFVLIVEKDCTFQRLIDDNFLKIYPAILITVRSQIIEFSLIRIHLVYS